MKKDDIDHLEWIWNRLVKVHKESMDIDYMDKFYYIIENEREKNFKAGELKNYVVANNHGGVTAQEAMDNMNNAIGGWTDLDIDNLPERFFTRDDIEIYRINDTLLDVDYSCKKNRITIVETMLDNKQYRYRIQEKKPIQITRDIINSITFEVGTMLTYAGDSDDLCKIDGRLVIIID